MLNGTSKISFGSLDPSIVNRPQLNQKSLESKMDISVVPEDVVEISSQPISEQGVVENESPVFVEEEQPQKKGLSTGAKIAIGLGTVAAAAIGAPFLCLGLRKGSLKDIDAYIVNNNDGFTEKAKKQIAKWGDSVNEFFLDFKVDDLLKDVKDDNGSIKNTLYKNIIQMDKESINKKDEVFRDALMKGLGTSQDDTAGNVEDDILRKLAKNIDETIKAPDSKDVKISPDGEVDTKNVSDNLKITEKEAQNVETPPAVEGAPENVPDSPKNTGKEAQNVETPPAVEGAPENVPDSPKIIEKNDGNFTVNIKGKEAKLKQVKIDDLECYCERGLANPKYVLVKTAEGNGVNIGKLSKEHWYSSQTMQVDKDMNIVGCIQGHIVIADKDGKKIFLDGSDSKKMKIANLMNIDGGGSYNKEIDKAYQIVYNTDDKYKLLYKDKDTGFKVDEEGCIMDEENYKIVTNRGWFSNNYQIKRVMGGNEVSPTSELVN